MLSFMVVVVRFQRARRTGERPPIGPQWAQIGVLVILTGLMLPGAGQHVLAAAVYVAAVAMMGLPVTQALTVVAVVFVAAETLSHTVEGWHDHGYGLAVLLAALAVWGGRLAFERNRRLAEAQGELARMAIENERNRIASDLHDILGHSLTVVTVKAELAQRLLDVDLDRARAELRDLERLCRDALGDVRATALGVRGMSLPGEIAAARAALAAADIQAQLPTAADDVPSRWRELFAWTIREAVTNLVRHSTAAHCEIRLTPASVEILDDGVGFADRTIGGDTDTGGGQGLAGLRRRAEALGASLRIGDRDDAPGFRVVVRVPS